MKTFYSEASRPAPTPSLERAADTGLRSPHASSKALIAVYEAPGAAPRVEEISPAPVAEFIEHIATRVHQLAGEAGGNLPYTVVREVTENLIHAAFAEPVISILDGGTTVRFADQGPGIPQKERAVLPGFTTAKGEMKAFIRGVGSGLPIVNDFLAFSGGTLVIEDNLGCGSVITIRCRPSSTSKRTEAVPHTALNPEHLSVDCDLLVEEGSTSLTRPRLSTRQKQVLALVLESGSAGPSLVAKELSIGLSTAYRDLALLEDAGLIEADGGKRTVTEQGFSFLDDLLTAR